MFSFIKYYFVLCIFTASETAQKDSSIIYILHWTYASNDSWIYHDLESGQNPFTSRNCAFKNCFITKNHSYFTSILDFDILLFNVVHLSQDPYLQLPDSRSYNQLYILLGFEPALNHKIQNFADFFNVTWTYKLESDIINPPFIVKNNRNKTIGPSKDVLWLTNDEMISTDKSILRKLSKKRSIATFNSNYVLSNDVFDFLKRLNNELSKYGHRVDIYNVTEQPNDKSDLIKYYELIESEYHFYLAFENSHNSDYVSNKLLIGLDNYAVPIVYGSANYTRYLPDGIYLDALKLGEEKLAKDMVDIVRDPKRYSEFFKWHGYYSFHDASKDHYREAICEFCAFINKRTKTNERKYYTDIAKWWNVPNTAHVIATRSIKDIVEKVEKVPDFIKSKLTLLSRTKVYTTIEEKTDVILSYFSDLLQYIWD